MKNIFLIIGIFVFIAAVAGFLYIDHSRNNYIPSDQDYENEEGNFNKIVLSFKNFNYYPNTVTVKQGETVRIYLDSSVGGCYRDFTLKDFGVSKYLPSPKDYVEFVADKKGTFRFSCSMGMGFGNLVVE